MDSPSPQEEGLSIAVQLFFIVQQLNHCDMLYLSRVRFQHLPGKGNGNVVAHLQVVRRNIRVPPCDFCLFFNRETKLAPEIDIVHVHASHGEGIPPNVRDRGVEGLSVKGGTFPAGRLIPGEVKHPRNGRAVAEQGKQQAGCFGLHNNTSSIIPLYLTDAKHSKMFPFSMIENPVDIFTHRIYNNNSRVVSYETSDGSDSSVK